MVAESDALRALATHLRSGSTLRTALLRWPEEAPGDVAAEVQTLARRIRLGCPVVRALDGLSLEQRLRIPFALHLSEGLSLAAWLERTADDLEATAAAAASARSSAAGAVLSGRMIAGLPLLFVLLAPISKAPLTDALGVGLVVLGVLLACAGLRWIGRLVPQPPPEDPVAGISSAVALLLEAGASLPQALEAACRALPALDRVPRLVRLGLSWPEALLATDERFRPLSVALEGASALGTPPAAGLMSLAEGRKAEAFQTFDRALRRAPVLMVVPLVCCVLPAYGLLGLAPFLRSVSLG